MLSSGIKEPWLLPSGPSSLHPEPPETPDGEKLIDWPCGLPSPSSSSTGAE